jgi:phospholipase/carboxylesterase
MAASTVAIATARQSNPVDELDGLFPKKRQKRDQPLERDERPAERGRLLARPGPVEDAAPPGLHSLGLGSGRDGFLYVPVGYAADHPVPLVLLLHGARTDANQGIAPLRRFVDADGPIVVATDARRETWDVIRGGYGPDVDFIDRALTQVFRRYAVDRAKLAVAGFSDGATYALSLGLTNGDLFTHVIAFTPGFMAPARRRGAPRVFVSHGTRDEVLPIDSCSRRIVPQLTRTGYDVHYREFDGPHTVPEEVSREALEWFSRRGAEAPSGAEVPPST